MIKLKNILREGVTPSILYHMTSLKSAINIFKKDQFVLGNTFFGGRDLDFQKGKYYYMSMARTKYGGYVQKHVKNTSVIFKLNGKKLGNNYETVPANFFERGEHEAEERLIHNDPVVKNASKYIESVHVLVRRPSLLNDGQKDNLKHLAKFGNKRNVPIYFYDETKYFATQRINYANKIEDFDDEDLRMFIYPKNYGMTDLLKNFINGDLDEKIKSADDQKFNSIIRELIADARKALKTPRYNDWKRKLQKRMEKYGVNTIYGLAKEIRNTDKK